MFISWDFLYMRIVWPELLCIQVTNPHLGSSHNTPIYDDANHLWGKP